MIPLHVCSFRHGIDTELIAVGLAGGPGDCAGGIQDGLRLGLGLGQEQVQVGSCCMAQYRQHRPWHAQRSSAPELHGKGGPLGLWQK